MRLGDLSWISQVGLTCGVVTPVASVDVRLRSIQNTASRRYRGRKFRERGTANVSSDATTCVE